VGAEVWAGGRVEMTSLFLALVLVALDEEVGGRRGRSGAVLEAEAGVGAAGGGGRGGRTMVSSLLLLVVLALGVQPFRLPLPLP